MKVSSRLLGKELRAALLALMLNESLPG